MTKSILSPSAKATPKVEPEPDTNGILPTDQNSDTTSTKWTVFKTNGDVFGVVVEGGRGRISIGGSPRGQGELRIYRNESTKTFDATFTGVEAAYSDRVSVEKLYNSRMSAAKAYSWDEPEPPEETVTSATFYAWHDLSPQIQSEYEIRASVAGVSAKDLYEEEHGHAR